MNTSLTGKVAAVTGGASGIGQACLEAMVAAGARVILIDRDDAAMEEICDRHTDAVVPLSMDLLDPNQCAELIPRILQHTDKLDIFHANAGSYLGGDLVDAQPDAIDRMLNLNINVVIKNVRDVVMHMTEQKGGDIIITSSLAAHFPTPWEPIYASSKWAINCFVQTTRRQVFRQGIRIGSVSPGPVETGLLADWPEENLQAAKQAGSLIEAKEIADAIMFMLSRPRNVTIRDVVIMPSCFDL